MRGRITYFLGALVVIYALITNGCAKMETLPQLEIQVVDEDGANVADAYVALFNSADEWNKRINPVQVWRKTDISGKVVFVDLNEIEYFIYVRYDGKDNSLYEVTTLEPLAVNTRKTMTIHIR